MIEYEIRDLYHTFLLEFIDIRVCPQQIVGGEVICSLLAIKISLHSFNY